jgi:hypothetical protein
MTGHAEWLRLLAVLGFSAFAACSALNPEKDAPPAPQDLEFPNVGVVPAQPGQPMLNKDQRQKLQQDLDRYKVGPD